MEVAPVSIPESIEAVVVRAADGLPVAGADVTIEVGGVVHPLRTDSEGHFPIPAGVVAGAEMVVQVIPPLDAGVASYGPLPRRVPAAIGSGGRVLRIRMGEDHPVKGTVEAAGSLVGGAKIVPYVVDEAFGVAERFDELAAYTQRDGQFELRGLPTGLAPYQVLALVVEDQRYPTTAAVQLGRRLEPY